MENKQSEKESNLLFEVVQLNGEADWQKLTVACPYLTEWGLKILKSGLRHDAKTVIVEKHYVCKDHTNLYSHFYSKRFHSGRRDTYRVHFFSSPFRNLTEWLWAEDKILEECYLGFSVIRNSVERCIGRTVLNPKKLAVLSKAYLLQTKFTATVLGRKITVSGFPYMSQDADVTVCAHTAIWSVCRYLSQKFHSYRELLPFDIVQSVEKTNGRAYPYRGMTYADYSQILNEYGVYPEIATRDDGEPGIKDLLYAYVESGFPVVASYGGHVAVVVGHDLRDEICTTPGQKYTSTSTLIKNYYVVDDNRFPYAALPVVKTGSGYSLDSIQTIVVPLPEKVFLSADKIHLFLNDYLNDKAFTDRMDDAVGGEYLLRVYLATSISYKRKMYEAPQENRDSTLITLLNMKLPHFIWVVEIMTVEAYKKREANCVLILDPTAPPEESADKVILFQKMDKSLTLSGQAVNLDATANTNKTMPMFQHNLG